MTGKTYEIEFNFYYYEQVFDAGIKNLKKE